jgi:arylsulfatase
MAAPVFIWEKSVDLPIHHRYEALMKFNAWKLAILAIATSVAGCDRPAQVSEQVYVQAATRPNILLIVADDLGYADLGVYGGDIDTPNIDALAERGMLFTQFHTAPYCAPTRAMLLSGNNNHVAGMAAQGWDGVAGVEVPGYENGLSGRIAPLPRVLRDAGYNTYTVGKWHLGRAPESGPRAAGFTRNFNLLDGAGTHFDAVGYSEGGSVYDRDGAPAEYPVGEYSTEVYTDALIEFIDEGLKDGRPFFAFAAYTSPHWPLQVPDKYLDLYAGAYDEGYDVLREQRFESLKAAGIIPQSSELPPRNEDVTPWDELDPEQQRIEAREMELYSAMVDNLDDHVGRLVTHLKEIGVYDTTLIVFMSDNGAAAEDFYNEGSYVEYLQANFDNSYEKMGTAESFVSYDDPWAEAGSAPFKRRKGYTTEGGIVAPMILAGPGVNASGRIDSGYVTVMDLAPTFIDLSGARYPEEDGIRPMLGESMQPFLAGEVETVHDESYVTALYHRGRAYLRQGRWKISNLEGPFDEADFELFDVIADPGETTDLSQSEPEQYETMLELWREERHRLGIILPQDI